MSAKLKTYSQKLQSPKWQKRRLEILNRDDFTCVGCGSNTITLHVHHKFYSKGREPWDYPDSHFVTLCEHCHERIELERERIELERERLLSAISTPQEMADVADVARLIRISDAPETIETINSSEDGLDELDRSSPSDTDLDIFFEQLRRSLER